MTDDCVQIINKEKGMRYLNIQSGILESFCVPRSLFPARGVFLDLQGATDEGGIGAILDVCEDKAQMSAFEDWAEISHDDHMFTIEMIKQNPGRYVEIDCPDEEIEDEKKLECMYAAARSKGVELDPNRNVTTFGGCPECHLLSGLIVEPIPGGHRFWCICHDHRLKWLWDDMMGENHFSEDDLRPLSVYRQVNPWPPVRLPTGKKAD